VAGARKFAAAVLVPGPGHAPIVPQK
jgi:hypothetical protein